MNRLLKYIIILFVLGVGTATAYMFNKPHKKRTYRLESIPTYDSLGNLYGTVKDYDHIPTHQDTIDFEKESEIDIQLMIDSNLKKINLDDIQ